MKAFVTAVLTLTLGASSVTASTKTYIYYTNAQCSDSMTISGTFNMGYDNYQLEGFGLEMDDYIGECMYFTDGYYEIGGGYDTAFDSFEEGYCIECNGNVGCSSTQSCDDFKTALPQNQPVYTMSMEGSNEVHSSNKFQSSAPEESELQAARDIEYLALMKLDIGSGKGWSSKVYAVGGTVVGLLALTLLLVSVQQWHKKRTRKQTGLPSISESLSPEIEAVNMW